MKIIKLAATAANDFGTIQPNKHNAYNKYLEAVTHWNM